MFVLSFKKKKKKFFISFSGDYLFNRVVWANGNVAAVMWCDRAQTWSVMVLCEFEDSDSVWLCDWVRLMPRLHLAVLTTRNET